MHFANYFLSFRHAQYRLSYLVMLNFACQLKTILVRKRGFKMLFKQLIEAFDIIDSKNVNGNSVASYLKSIKQDADIQVYPLVGPKVLQIC